MADSSHNNGQPEPVIPALPGLFHPLLYRFHTSAYFIILSFGEQKSEFIPVKAVNIFRRPCLTQETADHFQELIPLLLPAGIIHLAEIPQGYHQQRKPPARILLNHNFEHI